MDKQQARNILLGVNLGLAVAFLLFPKLSMRLYGVDPAENEAAPYAIRYLGGRLAVVAALLADPDGREPLLKQMPLIAGVDATANVLAAATGEVPKRALLLGSLTSVGTAALGFLARD